MSDLDCTPDPTPTPDLVPLVSVRTVATSEPDEPSQWQQGLINRLTEGEPIEARELHVGFTGVSPDFTLRISGRHTSGSEGPGQ